jgi:hypothetical protein
MKTYRHVVIVSGRFVFPIDMLRYDDCRPLSETDSLQIARSMDSRCTKYTYEEERKLKTREPFEVSILHYGLKSWEPTVDRWKSFGWKVLRHEIDGRLGGN